MDIAISQVEPSEAIEWERLRCALWPDGAHEHAGEIAAFFNGTAAEPQAVLVARDRDGAMVGIAELSVRYDVSGLARWRTGYVEGLYIVPQARGQGLTRKFLTACRKWALDQGCTACASDRAERVIIDRKFAALLSKFVQQRK